MRHSAPLRCVLRRVARWATALVACAVVFASTPMPEASAHGAIPRQADFVERVNRAIERGAEWLRSQQFKDGSFGEFPGYPASQTAITYLTLRVCGSPRTDPRMEAAYDAMRSQYLRARDDDQLRTYTAALIMMAIEQHGHPDTSTRLGEGYGNQGERRTRLDEPDLAWMRELVLFMEGNQTSGGTWRYGKKVGRYSGATVNNSDYDHSNTQYALLGLKSASRSGVDVDNDIYEKALRHLVDAQAQDGPEVPRVAFEKKGTTFADERDRARGWGYYELPRGSTTDRRRRGRADLAGVYGSMTAGSLGAVVICRSELLGKSGYSRKLDNEAEVAIWDGIAWLGRHFSVEANPRHRGWHFYYLYALERAGVLAGLDWIGEHDWYLEGAEYLLDRQADDGRWVEAGPDILATCFALLFLRKGTIPVARGAVTPSGGATSIDFSAAVGLAGKDLEDFIDLVLARWRKGTAESAREQLRRGLASVGEPVLMPLLTRMATGDDNERPAAHWFAAGITGLTLDYDAAAPTEDRYDRLMAWEEWYMARAGRLRFDATSGRLEAP